MRNKLSHNFFTTLLNLQLNLKMFFKVFLILLWLYIIMLISIIFVFQREYFDNIISLFGAFFKCLLNFDINNAIYNLKAGFIVLYGILKYMFFRTFYFWFLLPFILYIFKNKKKNNNGYIRGAKIIDIYDLKKVISKKECCLPFGNINMPVENENKHCFIVGRPGTGKTNCFNQIIESIKSVRKKKSIIYDFKGDFLAKFYVKGDLIFNPIDNRCLGWNIFNDINTVMDINAVAYALIPEVTKGDPFWSNAPRDMFIGILNYCIHNNKKTNKDIWNICTYSVEELAEIFKYTKGAEIAYKYFEDLDNKSLPSIMSVFAQSVRVFEYMQYIDGNFSITNWVNNNENNTIFITNYPDIKDTLKPAISLFIETVGRKLLSLPDEYDRRIFFMLDEFGTIQKMGTIVSLLTLGRSKGGAVFIGIQDVGQIDNVYGTQLRASIINACGTNLIFSVKDPTTSDFFSKHVGDTEYYEHNQSQSIGDKSDRFNINTQKRKELLILPSDIANLKDLTGYLAMANCDITFVEFNYKSYKLVTDSFKMRDEYFLEKYCEKQEIQQNIKTSVETETNFREIDKKFGII